jgi:type II secretory ATPase GspE/PulE/Tfp pilus assembly ATPase PilB-like protein
MQKILEEEMKAAPKSLAKRVEAFKKDGGVRAWKAQEDGCQTCGKSGYSGRVAVFEVLSMDKTVEEIILGDPTESKLEEAARAQGMVTMRQDGILKVLDGVTTMEEVLRVTGESNI